MEIIITNTSRAENYAAVEMTNGKQKVYVGRFARNGAITICNMNASHRAWRGIGRTFWTFDDAEKAYKSAFMKAAITMAQAYL